MDNLSNQMCQLNEVDNNKTVKNLNNKLVKYKTGLTKKVSSFKEESKEKSEIMKNFMKEDSPLVNGVTVLQKKLKDEFLKHDSSENEDDMSESKIRKITCGLGKKIKDIKSDIVEIKDESLQSLSDLKEIYQEKAEQKKAIINSFTEEEVKLMRKGAQLPAQFSKQINTLYLSKRLSVARFTILSCNQLDRDLVKCFDSIYVKVSIGLERFKTKILPISKSDPISWNETSVLPRQSAEDKHLELQLFARNSKDTVMLGQNCVDMNQLQADSIQKMKIQLRDENSVFTCELQIVVWLTGVNDSDVNKNEISPYQNDNNIPDNDHVGELSVTIIEATGLGSNKLQGNHYYYIYLGLHKHCCLFYDNLSSPSCHNQFIPLMLHFIIFVNQSKH